MSRVKWLIFLLWAVGLAVLAAGLYLIVHNRGSSTNTNTTEPSTTTSVRNLPPPRPKVATVRIYQVTAGGHTLEVHAFPPHGTADATSAFALLHIPGRVTVANGTATLTHTRPNISAEHVAEIVWTLTQFPTVKRVDLPGQKGLTRADEASYAPPIMLEAPLPPNPVPHTFHVSGTASVYEGTLVIELKVNGKTVERKTVTATAGAPELGSFDTVFHTTADGSATLLAYSPSAVDGSPQHEVQENLHLGR